MSVPTVNTLVEQYRAEKMPKGKMTRQGYNTWLTHNIIPTRAPVLCKSRRARPVDTSQSRTVRSSPPVANVLPSAVNAMLRTGPI